MTLTCIVVDDDPQAIKYLAECIALVPVLSLVNTYTDPKQALIDVKQLDTPVDFLFTDVEMPLLSGLLLAKEIKRQVRCIILVTAHPKYALDGYGINAKQFLTKPFNFKKFNAIVDELIVDLIKEVLFILVSTGIKTQVKLYVDEIIAIEAYGNYVKIHTLSDMLVVYSSFKAMVEKLEVHQQFKKISKSFMISVKHIRGRDGFVIFLKKNIAVTVGESHRSKFNKNFQGWFEKIFH
jgi:DNA-binding LytR/AlgR family response regulator